MATRRKSRQATKVVWRGIAFASQFERDFAKHLTRMGLEWEYEPDTIKWYPNPRHYKPDFKVFKKDGSFFYLETKGYFDGSSRAKMAAIKKQHPDIDIRMVFMDPNKKITAASKRKNPESSNAKTYADWAERAGYQWSTFIMPKEWKKGCIIKRRLKGDIGESDV